MRKCRIFAEKVVTTKEVIDILFPRWLENEELGTSI